MKTSKSVLLTLLLIFIPNPTLSKGVRNATIKAKPSSTPTPSTTTTTSTSSITPPPSPPTPPTPAPLPPAISVTYNVPCNKTVDCPLDKNFQCIHGSCSCGVTKIFDIRQGKCVIPLGKECVTSELGESLCPEFAECYRSQCVCKAGHTMISLTRCKLDSDERPKKKPIVLYPTKSTDEKDDDCNGECNEAKGQVCQAGVCKCKDKDAVFMGEGELGGCMNASMQATLKDALKTVSSSDEDIKTFVKLLERLETSSSKDQEPQGTQYSPIHQLLGLIGSEFHNNDFGATTAPTTLSQVAPPWSPRDLRASAQELVTASALPSDEGSGASAPQPSPQSPPPEKEEEGEETLEHSREPTIDQPTTPNNFQPQPASQNLQPQALEPASIVQRQAPPFSNPQGGLYPGVGIPLQGIGVIPGGPSQFRIPIQSGLGGYGQEDLGHDGLEYPGGFVPGQGVGDGGLTLAGISQGGALNGYGRGTPGHSGGLGHLGLSQGGFGQGAGGGGFGGLAQGGNFGHGLGQVGQGGGLGQGGFGGSGGLGQGGFGGAGGLGQGGFGAGGGLGQAGLGLGGGLGQGGVGVGGRFGQPGLRPAAPGLGGGLGLGRQPGLGGLGAAQRGGALGAPGAGLGHGGLGVNPGGHAGLGQGRAGAGLRPTGAAGGFGAGGLGRNPGLPHGGAGFGAGGLGPTAGLGPGGGGFGGGGLGPTGAGLGPLPGEGVPGEGGLGPGGPGQGGFEEAIHEGNLGRPAPPGHGRHGHGREDAVLFDVAEFIGRSLRLFEKFLPLIHAINDGLKDVIKKDPYPGGLDKREDAAAAAAKRDRRFGEEDDNFPNEGSLRLLQKFLSLANDKQFT